MDYSNEELKKAYEKGKQDALDNVYNRLIKTVYVMSSGFSNKKSYYSIINFNTTSINGCIYGSKEYPQRHVDAICDAFYKIVYEKEKET